MPFVIGREKDEAGPAGRLGAFRARDGSDGAPLYLDLDRPHAIVVVGKRGYGKSYTLGVVAEALARADGVAPVLIDPMGVFGGLAADSAGAPVPTNVIDDPRVAPSALDPAAWCELLGMAPESGPGALLWQGAQDGSTLAAMLEHVDGADASDVDRRAVRNHLRLAEGWDVFDPDGLAAADLAGPGVTVLDVAGRSEAAMNAVCRAVAEGLYRARVDADVARLPWLLLDEAHTFFDGVGRRGLERILTRGRAPGVSLVTATQRPSAVPETAISQSDVLVSHRLTAEADVAALEAAEPTYLSGAVEASLPTEPGDVLLVDDATETVQTATIRERDTPHGGDSPRASGVQR